MSRDQFVRRFASELRDLPWRTRRELVADLEHHLAEIPAEVDLYERLGSPGRYAREMRAAAGIETRRGLGAFLRARRPGKLIFVTGLAMILLTALAIGITALVWIDSYQPLSFGNAYAPPLNITRGFNGDTANVRGGTPFRLGIQIVNDQRFAVRVLGAPFDPEWPWKARLFMSVPGTPNSLDAPHPFHPVDLKPGQYLVLELRGVWECPTGTAPGNADGALEDFPVRYRFLWNTATAEIRLPEPLQIVFPDGCPPAKGGR